MMGDCDPSDDSQHWKFREVPEPFDENAYFNDGPIDDDSLDDDKFYDDDINDDYMDEESEFPSETDKQILQKKKKILYDRYDQVINLNEYIEYDKFKYSVITTTKEVWIYNEDLDLCLYSNGGCYASVLLVECYERDYGQLWYVPDNNKGYYINVDKDNISIIYTPLKELIYDDYMETLTISNKKYVRNNSSVITFEDGLLKIYDKFHDEEVCMDVPEEEKSYRSAFVNTVSCNETTTHWRITTEYPSN